MKYMYLCSNVERTDDSCQYSEGCVLEEPGGLWHPTFAPGYRKC